MKLCWSPPNSPRTRDSAWSWLVCFSGCLSMALVFGMLQCYAVVMPVLMDYFKESREKIAWGGSIAGGLIFFCVPLSTMVMTRLNIRYTAILGILMCITSLVATSFTTNIIQVFFSYSILYGLGMSLLFTCCIFATTKYFDKRQAIAIGIVTGGTNIGVLSLGPILQLLIDLYGFRTMYRIMAGSFVLPLLAVCSFDPNVKDSAAEEHRQRRDDEDQRDEWNWSMVPEIFKRPMYVVTLIAFTLQAMGAFIAFVHLVNYCREVGISAQKASNLFTAIGVSSLTSGIVSGRIMDHKRVNPFHVNQVGALSMGLATTLLQLSSSYIVFIFFSIFLGFGIGVFSTTIVVLLLRTVEPRLRLYSFPIGQMISAIGNITGAPLIGFIADTTGSYKPAFYTTGAILLLSFCLPFLQYCFKPWRTLEMEEQPTPTDTITKTVEIEEKAVHGDTRENEGVEDRWKIEEEPVHGERRENEDVEDSWEIEEEPVHGDTRENEDVEDSWEIEEEPVHGDTRENEGFENREIEEESVHGDTRENEVIEDKEQNGGEKGTVS